MLSVKHGASSNSFWDFGMTRRGIEPRIPEPLVNTLLISLIYMNYIQHWIKYIDKKGDHVENEYF